MFQKIGKSLTLSQEIEQKIESVIIEKKLIPGQKLPTEKEMCEMFGVSRTSLREALRMLSARGLISVKKGSGMYINDYSSSHATRSMSLYLNLNFDSRLILDVIKVRKILEPEIASMAAVNRTDFNIVELEKNIENFKKCPDYDVKKEGILDREFHLIIARSSGNSLIPLMVEPIFQQMPKIRALVYQNIDQAKSAALSYHLKIYEGIKNKKHSVAFEAMKKHIEIAEQHSKEIIKVL